MLEEAFTNFILSPFNSGQYNLSVSLTEIAATLIRNDAFIIKNVAYIITHTKKTNLRIKINETTNYCLQQFKNYHFKF